MAQFKQLDNMIFIGPQPSIQELEEAKHQGIRTVIDMRLPNETARPNSELAAEAGLAYVNIPVNRAALSISQVNEFDRVIKQHAGPFLVHCATGARAALMILVSRARENNWTAQQVFGEAVLMGFDLRNAPEFAQFVSQSTHASS